MSIGYSQFPTWVTTNSSNSTSNESNIPKTSGNRQSIPRSNSTNYAAQAEKKLNQSTGSFMREVFSTTNAGVAHGSSNSGETKIDKKNTLHLPAVVDIDGVKVRTNNKKDEDVIQELSQKTRKSPMMVESELKRKYTSRLSSSLDMNA